MITTGATSGSLLIVDDDEALAQLLAWDFEDIGYAVCRAADCHQAAALARTTAFEFALVDYHLPDGDGRSLSRRLKRLLPGLLIVVMSADRARATAGGTDISVTAAFVEKPVPTARIHHMFSVRRTPEKQMARDRRPC